MSDGEVMMTVLQLQRRLDLAEQEIVKLQSDEWYKSNMFIRGLLVFTYFLIAAASFVGAVGVVLGVAWLIGQVIAGLQ